MSRAELNSLAARRLSHGDQWNAGFHFRGNRSSFYSVEETLPGTPKRLARSGSSRPIAAQQNAAYRSHSELYRRGRVSSAWKVLGTFFFHPLYLNSAGLDPAPHRRCKLGSQYSVPIQVP